MPEATTPPSLVLRFSAGAAMGTLIVSVPFAAGHPLQFSSVEIVAAALVVSTSGVLGCLWGGRFLEAISRALDSTAV